jgi:hypothetical protein
MAAKNTTIRVSERTKARLAAVREGLECVMEHTPLPVCFDGADAKNPAAPDISDDSIINYLLDRRDRYAVQRAIRNRRWRAKRRGKRPKKAPLPG